MSGTAQSQCCVSVTAPSSQNFPSPPTTPGPSSTRTPRSPPPRPATTALLSVPESPTTPGRREGDPFVPSVSSRSSTSCTGSALRPFRGRVLLHRVDGPHVGRGHSVAPHLLTIVHGAAVHMRVQLFTAFHCFGSTRRSGTAGRLALPCLPGLLIAGGTAFPSKMGTKFLGTSRVLCST